jgi:hypothetical protein
MKNRVLIITSLLVLIVAGCRKDEKKIFFEGGTAPTLSANKTGTIPLSFANKDQEALKLSWTNPDYRFTTGPSSQNVNYQIEFDTTGSNFSNPQKQTFAVSTELSKSFTQTEFNDFLLNQLVLKPGQPHNLEVRVKSFLGTNAVPMTSNVLKYVVTPYAIPPKVNPPSTGKLFITGSATPASWQCGCGEAELASQKFTQVSPTLYVLNSITLTGGGSYLLLPQYGSWSAKYGAVGANNSNNVDGDDFRENGGDLLAPPSTGNYKIEVDFQRGKFKVTKL